jgi:hypothetical protein
MRSSRWTVITARLVDQTSRIPSGSRLRGGMLTIAAVGLLTLGVWVVRDGLTA